MNERIYVDQAGGANFDESLDNKQNKLETYRRLLTSENVINVDSRGEVHLEEGFMKEKRYARVFSFLKTLDDDSLEYIAQNMQDDKFVSLEKSERARNDLLKK